MTSRAKRHRPVTIETFEAMSPELADFMRKELAFLKLAYQLDREQDVDRRETLRAAAWTALWQVVDRVEPNEEIFECHLESAIGFVSSPDYEELIKRFDRPDQTAS